MFLTLSLIAALAAGPTQTEPTTPKQQRAANRQALREARQADVPYKESHLTVTPAQLERGSTAGPPGSANQLRMRPNGSPLPTKRSRRPGPAKTEPTP